MPEPEQPLSFPGRNPGQVSIGHDVWIGQDALLKGGIKIETGSVIAAGSVVTRDVAAYSIVGGVPARVIRQRFEVAVAKRILATEWWMAEPENIVDLPFDSPLDFLRLAEEKRLGWRVKPFDYRRLGEHVATGFLRGVDAA